MAAFSFIDSVSEVKRNESLTAFFSLKGSEEFLKDHFAGFPVMPGVLLLESLRQAAAALLADSSQNGGGFFRLAEVEEVKFGQFVRPGNRLKLFVRLVPSKNTSLAASFEGRIHLMQGQVEAGKALSAKFSLGRV